MKEIKFKVEINYDFELFGIISSLKDYKLAWQINHELKLTFVKVEDHEAYHTKTNRVEVSSFEHLAQGTVMHLLSNKVYKQYDEQQEYLVPELKQFDYFLRKEGEVNDVTNFTNKLKQINGIEFITNIDLMKLKSKENFIF